jgi:hypothetical protein
MAQRWAAANLGEVAEFFGVSLDAVKRWRQHGLEGAAPYDLASIAEWLYTLGPRRPRQKSTARPDADPARPKAKASDEIHRWKAKRERFFYQRDLGRWIKRSEVHAGLAIFAKLIHGAGDMLQRKFGAEAYSILAEAILDAEAAFRRTFGDDPQTKPVAEHANDPSGS